MSRILSEEEQYLMRKSGQITAQALKKTLESVRAGISLLELEKIAEQEIKRLGGESSFKTVPGYEFTTCLNINNEVVHGLPRDIILKTSDLLSIDLGAIYQGWHTDASWSVVVGGGENNFLKVGEQALWLGIDQAKEGNRIGDIASAIQKAVEGKGYSIVRSLVGHGVGRNLHEDPEVPGFGTKGTGPLLKSGMPLAIEVIYTESTKEVTLASDGWTIISLDGSLAGLFEMTVVVGKDRNEVLTDWRTS